MAEDYAKVLPQPEYKEAYELLLVSWIAGPWPYLIMVHTVHTVHTV